MQAGTLRRTPASLAGDDLVIVVAQRADNDGLDDAALADRGSELFKLGLGEVLARVARIGAQVLDWRAARLAPAVIRRDLRLLTDIADQRGEASSQTRSLIRH